MKKKTWKNNYLDEILTCLYEIIFTQNYIHQMKLKFIGFLPEGRVIVTKYKVKFYFST